MKFLSNWKYSIMAVLTMAILSGLAMTYIEPPFGYIPVFFSFPVGLWAGHMDSRQLRNRYR